MARSAENAGSVSTARTSACRDAAHTSWPLRGSVTFVIGPGEVIEASPWNGQARGGKASGIGRTPKMIWKKVVHLSSTVVIRTRSVHFRANVIIRG
ncbi:hypothetical protein JCM33774_88600 [Actinophytocola sp. KF-1]